MNWVRHSGSTTFETKSSYSRDKVEFNSISWVRMAVARRLKPALQEKKDFYFYIHTWQRLPIAPRVMSLNAPINVNPVVGGRGECVQGAGIWCLRLSPCRAFDRGKRPRGRDIWLWLTEAWYQFRSGYQIRPSRLSEGHAVGERCEVFICFYCHNPIL